MLAQAALTEDRKRSVALLSDQIIESFIGSPERLTTYLGLLCHDLGDQLAAMDAACETGDCEALHRAAHAAKGVARGLRDPSLASLAAEIERLAKDADLCGIREKLADFATGYLAVKN